MSEFFDATYQKVKISLFKGGANDHNEKDVLNALAKIKVFAKAKLLNKDYLDDLLIVVKADALSGHEIRYINQLSVKNVNELPKRYQLSIWLASSLHRTAWMKERRL